MKRSLPAALGLAALAVLALPQDAVSISSGAPPRFSGAPGENTCTLCHNTFPLNSGTGGVTVEGPATFAPGDTITLTVAVDNTTPLGGSVLRQGFQLSAKGPDDADAGTFMLVDTAVTRFANSNPRYVTHTLSGVQQDTWEVAWAAPEGGAAPTAVTFYVAGNAGNGDTTSDDDYIYTSSLTVARAGTAGDGGPTLAFRLGDAYPNPARESVHLDLTLERPLAVTVTLYDVRGRAVRTLEPGVLSGGPQRLSIALDGLTTGVYFAEVRTPDGAASRALLHVQG